MSLRPALTGAILALFTPSLSTDRPALVLLAARPAAPAAADDPPAVSYYKDVRPILQQHCNGCHQPAKPQGGYVTTGHADLLKSGERGKPGVVVGKPAASY